jgi:hypothetical protein
MRIVALLLLLSVTGTIHAQNPDILNTKYEQDSTWRADHSPKKAAIFSAILPGAGQIYNRKYWKLPIVWGGLGVTMYYAQYNHDRYVMYRDALVAITDGDPTTVDPFNGEFTAGFVEQNVDFHRRYRDLSYIGFGLVYVLNILDASIDANFARFDVSDDLTLAISPIYHAGATENLALGLTFTLR